MLINAMEKYLIAKLLKKDEVINDIYGQLLLQKLVIKPVKISNSDSYFNNLCLSIISQQLSITVANKIADRVRELLETKNIIVEEVITAKIEDLRKAGLSYAKIGYLKNLAEAWTNGTIRYQLFAQLSAEEIITELVMVKGIGIWTAEMFLIFSLGRGDIFSAGDLVLRKRAIKYYGLSESIKLAELRTFAESKWSPYRSLVSRILWASNELN